MRVCIPVVKKEPERRSGAFRYDANPAGGSENGISFHRGEPIIKISHHTNVRLYLKILLHELLRSKTYC
jgi:hypothetical protein